MVSRLFPVALARGKHLFPFRTEQLSPSAPMVLGSQGPGRVGRRRFFLDDEPGTPRASRARRRSGRARAPGCAPSRGDRAGSSAGEVVRRRCARASGRSAGGGVGAAGRWGARGAVSGAHGVRQGCGCAGGAGRRRLVREIVRWCGCDGARLAGLAGPASACGAAGAVESIASAGSSRAAAAVDGRKGNMCS